MTTADPAPLVIWAVSDGRAGNAAPVLGLAEAVAGLRLAHIETRTIAWKGRRGRLPWFLNLMPRGGLEPGHDLAPPWPDLWIAAGRATLPLSVGVRSWSRRKTFVVQLQDPRAPAGLFDLVVPPRHDRMSGSNVFPITGSPHRVTPERLAAEAARFAAEIDPLPHPRAAVLIGGTSKAFDLSPERAAVIAREIEEAVSASGGSILMTFSRRTPDAARSILDARLRGLPGVIWSGEGDNPYFAFLALADVILVTEDSANMAAEAASTGKPVFVLKMDGKSAKFALLHEDLEARGAARPFAGAFHGWSYAPLDETGRAAREVLRRMALPSLPRGEQV